MTHQYEALRVNGRAGGSPDIPEAQLSRNGYGQSMPMFDEFWWFGTLDTGTGSDSLVGKQQGLTLVPFGTAPTYGTNYLTTLNGGAHGVKCANALLDDTYNFTSAGVVQRASASSGNNRVQQWWSSYTNTVGDGGDGLVADTSTNTPVSAYTRNFTATLKSPASGAWYTEIALSAPFIYVLTVERPFGVAALDTTARVQDRRRLLIMAPNKTIWTVSDQSGISPKGKNSRTVAGNGISFGSTDLTSTFFNNSVTGYGGGVARRAFSRQEMVAAATAMWHVASQRGVW